MPTLNFPAAQVQQGALTLYSTAIKVEILTRDDFYSVETLDPSQNGDSGYQRLLNQARARRLADYIVKGQEYRDAFLPTSVFLATENPIDFDPTTNTISFDTSTIGPFSVVDGQHRLEGLKLAVEKDKRVLDFVVPVNIAVNLPKLHQMCHFLIVNTTQKSVEKSVEQQIVARLTDSLDIEDMPSLPNWIQKLVEKGEVNKALGIVDFLNSQSDSPWLGRVKMANDSGTNMINQGSFVKAIVRYVLTANNPLAALNDFDKEKRIFLNYWKAISEEIDDGHASILYRYNGMELFCKFSIPFFTRLMNNGKFTVDVMKDLLSECFENVEGEFAGVGHSQWWIKGGKASGMNSNAISQVVQEMAKALNKPTMSSEIEI